MENKNDTFSYKYSAEEQEEIKKIRAKYSPKEDVVDKMEQLRRLDAYVTKKGTVWALCIGIISALVMGSGMSLVMTDIGAMIGVDNAMVVGIIVGVIGLVGALLSYPVYKSVTAKEREKITPEILRLTDELMK